MTASGEIRWVSIGLYDDMVIDGDVVRVTAGAVDVMVSLGHAAQHILIPVAGTAPTLITVQGVSDGGGGVTVGLMGPGGRVPFPYLEEGVQASFYAY